MCSVLQKLVSSALILALAAGLGFAQGKGQGKGKGHDKDNPGDSERGDRHYSFSDHDREAIRGWYSEHLDNLPPGLAKKDRLPPGLERQLRERGTLPPGLQKRVSYLPEDLERQLPPPPPECRHVILGGHVLIMNVTTHYVHAIFHIELP